MFFDLLDKKNVHVKMTDLQTQDNFEQIKYSINEEFKELSMK